MHSITHSQSKPSFCAHADNDTKYMYTIRGALQNYKHLSGTLQRGKLWWHAKYCLKIQFSHFFLHGQVYLACPIFSTDYTEEGEIDY